MRLQILLDTHCSVYAICIRHYTMYYDGAATVVVVPLAFLISPHPQPTVAAFFFGGPQLPLPDIGPKDELAYASFVLCMFFFR